MRGPGLGPAGPGAACGAGAGPRGCPASPCPPQAAEEREWRRRAARLWAEMERERRMDEALRAVSAAGAAALGEGEAEGECSPGFTSGCLKLSLLLSLLTTIY